MLPPNVTRVTALPATQKQSRHINGISFIINVPCFRAPTSLAAPRLSYSRVVYWHLEEDAVRTEQRGTTFGP